MKKKIPCILLLLLFFAFGLTMNIHAQSEQVRVDGMTTSSISISWDDMSNTSSTLLSYEAVCVAPDGTQISSGSLSPYIRSCTINGLLPNTSYSVLVKYTLQYPNGNTFTGSKYGQGKYGSGTYGPGTKTTPAKVTKFKSYNYQNQQTGLYVEWELPSAGKACLDYQYEIYNSAGSLLMTGTTSLGYLRLSSFAYNKQLTKIRVRGFNYYGMNPSNVISYADWSSFKWLIPQPIVQSQNTNGIMKLSWNKISGANKYTVYISTNPDSGYKKVVATNKNSAVIKKFKGKKFKSDTRYYVKVLTSAKSQTSTKWHYFIWRYF